jgi:succinoglycan biosynthesis transport protein ExoP
LIDDTGRPGRPMADYVRVIRRGWWIVLATLVLVTAVTYFISSRQAPLFQATADDLITTLDLNNPTANTHTSSGSAQQYVATMAQVAQSPQVVEFKVSYHTKQGAVDLTNAYAQAFAEYSKRQQNARVARLVTSAQNLATNLHKLADRAFQKYQADKAAGLPSGAIQNDYKNYNDLAGKAARADGAVLLIQTQADATLGQIQVQSKASGAQQLAPNTSRNTVIGFILGLVLGIGLVFAREAFDTRIRSADQVAAELGLPLFGRLPRPDKDMRRHDQLTLLADPHGIHSEAYKKLRVSLDFANLDPQAQMLLITSAVAQEGKSTTAANLAVAMAAAGKNVILVDLDLRAPYLDRFFGLTGRPGITDVILGQATLDEALVPVVVPGAPDPGARRNGHGNEPSGSLLHVLVAGEPPSDPSSLLASKALATLLTELRERADTIVIDTPPVLPVADTMGLTSQADAYIVVSKLDLVRRPMLHELRRELGTARALGLGVVVTDAESESGYGYGGYGYGGYGAPADQAARTRAGQ